MTKGNLNKSKIEKLCKKYGYDHKYFGCVALITTGVDEWKLSSARVDANGEVNLIKIDHLNTAGNRRGKIKFHKQRHSNSLDFVFDRVISTHESVSGAYNSVFNIKELLKLG